MLYKSYLSECLSSYDPNSDTDNGPNRKNLENNRKISTNCSLDSRFF